MARRASKYGPVEASSGQLDELQTPRFGQSLPSFPKARKEQEPGSVMPGLVETRCSLFFSFLGSPLCGSFNSDAILHLRCDRDAGKWY